MHKIKNCQELDFESLSNRCIERMGSRESVSADAPCEQFGDVSYLLESNYEGWLQEAVRTLPKLSVESIRNAATVTTAWKVAWSTARSAPTRPADSIIFLGAILDLFSL